MQPYTHTSVVKAGVLISTEQFLFIKLLFYFTLHFSSTDRQLYSLKVF